MGEDKEGSGDGNKRRVKKKSLEEFLTFRKDRPGELGRQPVNEAYYLGLKRRRFWEMAQRPEWHCLSLKDKAEILDVSTVTVRNWENSLSDEEWKKALETARGRSGRMSLKVDAAVTKESLNGNTKAAELYYRRIEGWAPKSGMELTRGEDGNLSKAGDRELLVGLLASLSAEERAGLMAEAARTEMKVPAEPGSGFMEMKGVTDETGSEADGGMGEGKTEEISQEVEGGEAVKNDG